MLEKECAMKKRLWLLVFPVAAVILEALPWGVIMFFANPEGEPWKRTYSYFSMIPYGYATFYPLAVAILTCVITVLSVIYLFKAHKVIHRAISIVCVVALLLSLTPVLYGLKYISPVGICVSASLLLNLLVLYLTREK